MTKTRPDPQPGIAAKYETWCARCEEPIHRQDRIVYSHGRPIHVECASGHDDD